MKGLVRNPHKYKSFVQGLYVIFEKLSRKSMKIRKIQKMILFVISYVFVFEWIFEEKSVKIEVETWKIQKILSAGISQNPFIRFNPFWIFRALRILDRWHHRCVHYNISINSYYRIKPF